MSVLICLSIFVVGLVIIHACDILSKTNDEEDKTDEP